MGQHEATVQSLKKKHCDATAEMAEQVDQLNKMRSKVEKEKHAKNLQIEEVRAAMDVVANEKATLEKQNRLLEQQRLDITRRGEEANLTLSDYDNSRKKVVIENAELLHSIEELENNNAVLGKLRQTLTQQLDEVNKIAEKEGLAKAEEAESAKMKLQSGLAEAEGCVSNLNGKAMALEREKAKLQAEIEEAIVAVEDAEARCMAMEKKARNFDKIVAEWKNKIEGLQSELDQTQVECRSYSTELFKVKTTYDETN